MTLATVYFIYFTGRDGRVCWWNGVVL